MLDLDMNEALTASCDAMLQSLSHYKKWEYVFGNRKLTQRQRAYLNRLSDDIEKILKSDNLKPETNIVKVEFGR